MHPPQRRWLTRRFTALRILASGPLLTALLWAVPRSAYPADWVPGSLREVGRLPGGGLAWERDVVAGEETVRLTGISFRPEFLALRVADNPPESARKLAEAASQSGAVAGCNASYFHEDGRPLGLVVQDGAILHGQERAKLLSGVLAVRQGRLELTRSESFRLDDRVRQAVQSGPWLIEDGRPLPGLEAGRRARRTVIAADSAGGWVLLAFSPVTLRATARILSQEGVLPQGSVRQALNLDGGSSTALWAGSVGLSVSEFGTVRNFLLLTPSTRKER